MHRGKIHDSGGDAMVPSHAAIEVFNKNDSVRERRRDADGVERDVPVNSSPLRSPRIRTMIPFNPNNVLNEEGNPVTPNEISRGQAVTFKIREDQVNGIRILSAYEVRLEDHGMFSTSHPNYLRTGVRAVILGAVVLFGLGFAIHGLLIPGKQFVSHASIEVVRESPNLYWLGGMNLLYGIFLTLIVWIWAGNRSFMGGLRSGLWTGLFVGAGTGLFIMGTTEIFSLAGVAIAILSSGLRFALAGAVIGHIIGSRRSGIWQNDQLTVTNECDTFRRTP